MILRIYYSLMQNPLKPQHEKKKKHSISEASVTTFASLETKTTNNKIHWSTSISFSKLKKKSTDNWMHTLKKKNLKWKIFTFSYVKLSHFFTLLWLTVTNDKSHTHTQRWKEVLEGLISFSGICAQHKQILLLESYLQRYLCTLLVSHWHLKDF